jgi:hypothetical protein
MWDALKPCYGTAWRQRQEAPRKRAAENARLTAEIQGVFQEHRDFYSSPRIHQELRAAGHRWAVTVSPGSCAVPISGAPAHRAYASAISSAAAPAALCRPPLHQPR